MADNASYIDLICSGSYSCQYSKIFHYEITASYVSIYCNYYSCLYFYIIVSAIDSNIYCRGTYSCRNSKLYCNAESLCNIKCATTTSCYNANIYGKEGSKNINVTHDITTKFTSSITLHCGYIYQFSCTLQWNNYSNILNCESSEICYDYELDLINTDYILFDLDYYNYRQNVSCNESKLNCEIYCIGISSCRYGYINCPTNFESICSIYAGYYASANTDIVTQNIDEFHLNFHLLQCLLNRIYLNRPLHTQMDYKLINLINIRNIVTIHQTLMSLFLINMFVSINIKSM